MNRLLRYSVLIVAALSVGCNGTTGSMRKEDLGSALGAVGGA